MMISPSKAVPDAPVVTPVSENERIILLDSLRGIAVLGILIMNIPGFGLPYGQIFDPFIMGETSGADFYSYYLVELAVEGTQRALFSMLFGASMILFIDRLQQKMDGLMVAEYFFRRQLWLLLFGLFNAYVLLWYWDILFHYAVLGMILFVFRRMPVKALLIAAGICLAIMTFRENLQFYHDKAVIKKGELVQAIDTTKTKLSDAQKEQLEAYQGFKQRMTKESKKKRIEKNVRMVQGTYSDLYQAHSERAYEGETAGMFHFLIWDGLILMFLGIAFYKSGVLTGLAPGWLYWALFIGGFAIGIPLSYLRLQPMIDSGFNYFEVARNYDFQFYELSRVLRSLGVFGLIMVAYRSGWLSAIFSLMRPVGQMAFTNYLLQSFICGLIFYGVGFGLFARLDRAQLFYVVGAVWIFEIILSHLWLKFFRFGPLEWLWRSLTYWQWQPIKR
jgi:uncharacterized protein